MMNTTTARDQFESICQIAISEKNQERSALHVASVSDDGKRLTVFGWAFGVTNVVKSADEILTGWDRVTGDSVGMTNSITYKNDGYTVTLTYMI